MTGVKRLSGGLHPLPMHVNHDPGFPNHTPDLSVCGCIPPAEGVFCFIRIATHHDEFGYPMHASTHSTDSLQPLDGAPGQAERDTLIRWYRLMHLGRILDERIARERHTAAASTPSTPALFMSSAGCEGLQLSLGLHVHGDRDMLFPDRGDLVTALSAKLSLEDILLTAFGKAGDPAGGGRGLRDMFADPKAGLQPVSASDASRARQAVGAARAYHSFGDEGIVFCSLDAPATAQGAFFEALSDAARERLPVLFVLQERGNDADGERAADGDALEASVGHEFQGLTGLRLLDCDGTNVFDAWQTMEDAVNYVRSGAGAALLHAACGWAGAPNDPVSRYRQWLLDSAAADETELDTLEKENLAAVEGAAAHARSAPDPDPSHVHRGVFADDTHVCPLSNDDFSRLMAKHADELDTVSLREAIARSLTDEFRRNPSTFLLAQDAATGDTNPRANLTAVMQNEFGQHRVMRFPFSSAHLIGAAAGICRVRDDIWTVIDATPGNDNVLDALQEISAAAEASWRSNGGFTPNILLRLAAGGSGSPGTERFRDIEGFLVGSPGMRIVAPAFADDAAGLLRCAFRTRGLTVFLEPASLLDHDAASSLHPTPDLCVPIGRARVRREGNSISIITYGGAVHLCLQAAEALSAQGIEAEVLDLRSILPFDTDTIRASVGRTGRALVVHESQKTGGFGGEIASWIGEHCFDDLDAPVRRLAARDIPAAPAGPLADAVFPGATDVEAAAEALANY